VLGVICLGFGIKRAYRAVTEFEDYRWTTLRLALFKLVWFIQG